MASVIIWFVLFTKRNTGGRKGSSRNTGRAFLGLIMADRRALKLIGIMFAALTLMVISRAAVVVAGQAASSVDGEYLNLAVHRD